MLNENVSAKHLKTYNKVEAATINLVFMGEKFLGILKTIWLGPMYMYYNFYVANLILLTFKVGIEGH